MGEQTILYDHKDEEKWKHINKIYIIEDVIKFTECIGSNEHLNFNLFNADLEFNNYSGIIITKSELDKCINGQTYEVFNKKDKKIIPETQQQVKSIKLYQSVERRVDSDLSYFDIQKGGLGCGRHALNNLLGYTAFIEGLNFNIIGLRKLQLLEQVPLSNVCALSKKIQFETRSSYCRIDEYYDAEVLKLGLAIKGFRTEEINLKGVVHDEHSVHYGEKVINIENEPEKNVIGYLINLPGHWVSIKKFENSRTLYYYNSLSSKYHEYENMTAFYKQYDYIKQVIKVYNEESTIMEYINEISKHIKIGDEIANEDITEVETAKIKLKKMVMHHLTKLYLNEDMNETTKSKIAEKLTDTSSLETIDTIMKYMYDEEKRIKLFNYINLFLEPFEQYDAKYIITNFEKYYETQYNKSGGSLNPIKLKYLKYRSEYLELKNKSK